MKFAVRFLFLALFFAPLAFSCKSAPSVPDAGEGREAFPPETAAPALPPSEGESGEALPEPSFEEAAPEETPSQADAELPAESLPPEDMPPEPPLAEEEPLPETPLPEETDGPSPGAEIPDGEAPDGDPPAASFPPETPVEESPALPEPGPFALPETPLPPEEDPALPETPSREADAAPPAEPPLPEPEIPSPSASPREPPLPAEPPRPPSPPSFLRPAEPELPPPSAQAVPLPSTPPPDLPAREPPKTPGEEIAFSRVVRATVGQTIEIPFRGLGWVYLGELGNRRGLAYESRRLDVGSSPGSIEGQSFIFRAEAAGTYILKFFKQDFIQDYIINDHVQAIIGEDPETAGTGRYSADRGRAIAEPRWPPAPGLSPGAEDSGPPASSPRPAEPSAPAPQEPQEPPESPEAVPPDPPRAQSPEPAPVPQEPSGEPPPSAAVSPSPPPRNPPPAEAAAPGAAAPQTALPPAAPRPRQSAADDGIVAVTPPQAASPGLSPDAAPAEYTRQAKQEFDAGRIESALSVLDAMKRRFPSGTDEAWWLYGQLLEANSPGRDIRLALEYYRRLVREYPQSPRAADAQRRIAYLERYYFNIR